MELLSAGDAESLEPFPKRSKNNNSSSPQFPSMTDTGDPGLVPETHQLGELENIFSSSVPGFSDSTDIGISYPAKLQLNNFGRGLRQLTKKVCDITREGKLTTYKQVADVLIMEMYHDQETSQSDDGTPLDEKNIRRRVYDSLNVLMAINILSKKNKTIEWLGLPNNFSQENELLEYERRRRAERLKHKQNLLREKITILVGMQLLKQHNRNQVEQKKELIRGYEKLQWPVIFFTVKQKTNVELQISEDRRDLLAEANGNFRLMDQAEFLRSSGLAPGLCSNVACPPDEREKILQLLPPVLRAEAGKLFTALSITS